MAIVQVIPVNRQVQKKQNNMRLYIYIYIVFQCLLYTTPIINVNNEKSKQMEKWKNERKVLYVPISHFSRWYEHYILGGKNVTLSM